MEPLSIDRAADRLSFSSLVTSISHRKQPSSLENSLSSLAMSTSMPFGWSTVTLASLLLNASLVLSHPAALSIAPSTSPAPLNSSAATVTDKNAGGFTVHGFKLHDYQNATDTQDTIHSSISFQLLDSVTPDKSTNCNAVLSLGRDNRNITSQSVGCDSSSYQAQLIGTHVQPGHLDFDFSHVYVGQAVP